MNMLARIQVHPDRKFRLPYEDAGDMAVELIFETFEIPPDHPFDRRRKPFYGCVLRGIEIERWRGSRADAELMFPDRINALEAWADEQMNAL